MEKEYVVTVKEGVSWEDLHNDLIADGTIDPSVIPARPVEIANFREQSERNTHYFLTEEEAEALRNDPRVDSVEDPKSFKPVSFKFQDSVFDKQPGSEGQRVNWGLVRHIKKFNVWGGSVTDVAYDYDYVLDGTGVDIVILDAGIEPNHPEFMDAEGNSRVRQINWYLTTGQPGFMPPNHYSDYDGHGTHVAATAAGKTYGWAKNADIYFMKIVPEANDPNGTIPIEDAMDMLYAWHIGKGNLRPTVLNNSWGYQIFWHTNIDALSFSPNSGPYYAITNCGFRGFTVPSPEKDPDIGHIGKQIAPTVYAFPLQYNAVDADIQQLVAAGVVVCNAAGNNSQKADVPGGIDYNNFVNAAGRYYYHRPGSPDTGNYPGFKVGALDSVTTNNKDQRADYSNTGPAVNIWAAGTDIQSAFSTVNTPNTSFAYYLDGTWRQQNYSGTSMACPQIAGMAALVLQVYPDWSPNQVVKFLTSNAQAEIFSTGQIGDYAVTNSLHGSPNRLAYFPMNGRTTFGYFGDQMTIAS